MTRGVPAGVDWSIFEACKTCGARAETACFRHNGSRARQACSNRPFKPDAVRDKFAEMEGRVALLDAQISDAWRVITKQQRQIDLLLGEWTE